MPLLGNTEMRNKPNKMQNNRRPRRYPAKNRGPRRYSLVGKYALQLEPRLLLSAAGSSLQHLSDDWFIRYPAAELPTHLRVAGPVQNELKSIRWMIDLSPQAMREIRAVGEVDEFFAQAELPVTVERGLGRAGQLLVQTDSLSAPFAERVLQNSSLVKSVERDRETQGQATPNDSLFTNQSAFLAPTISENTIGIDAIGAWDQSIGSSKVVIAVIDSGIDLLHPDISSNLWSNTDNLHGYDFVSNDSIPMDENGHGTNVAGIIAARGNNNQGVAGVMWQAQLMSIRYLDETNNGTVANAVAAVNYVTLMKQRGVNIRAINASWGFYGDFSQSLYDAIAAAGEENILFVAAAGNGGPLGGIQLDRQRVAFYPASFELENIISVGASDTDGTLASFSNYGTTSVDLLAPGVGILTTAPGSKVVNGVKLGNYATRNGTSFATPLVTGTAGLLFSKFPDASVAEVKEAILQQVTALTSLNSVVGSSGVLNSARALLADTFAPSARLSASTPVTNLSTSGQTLSFAVEFYQESSAGIVANSIDEQAIGMRRVGWQGFSKPITLESRSTPDIAGQITAEFEYAIGDATENGEYEIVLRGDRVRDTRGVAAREKVLARFRIQIADTNVISVNSFADNAFVQIVNGVPVNSNGLTSLRTAIQYANDTPGKQTILLPDGTYSLTRSANWQDDDSYRDLDITSDIMILGSGQDFVNIFSSTGDRVFKVTASGKLELQDLTIAGGRATTTHALGMMGGGIHNQGTLNVKRSRLTNHIAGDSGGAVANFGTATFEQSSIEGNLTTNLVDAAGGGGIFNAGTIMIARSTIAENSTVAGAGGNGGGGGILNASGGNLTLWTSTISTNSAVRGSGGGIYNQGNANLNHVTITLNSDSLGGGGIFSESGQVSFAVSIIAKNDSANTSREDLNGNEFEFISGGENIIGSIQEFNSIFGDLLGTPESPLDPMLGPLTNNGGLTRTHAPLVGSPAVDNRSNYLTGVDQVGSVQLGTAPSTMGGSQADVGAFERVNTMISGRVFEDANGNGALDSNESGLANAELYVDENRNGFRDDGELSVFSLYDDPATPLINETGMFTFDNRPSNPLNPIDTYRIGVVSPSGFENSVPASPGMVVADINAGFSNSYPGGLINVNGTLFFSANNGTSGVELWKSNGVGSNTAQVLEIAPSLNSSYPGNFTNVNGTLFFTANDGSNGNELWKSDGSVAGTYLVRDIDSGLSSAFPNNLTDVNGTLFFEAYDGAAFGLWKSDGTTAGTVKFLNLNSSYLTNVNGTLFFVTNDGATGFELWKSNGTIAGTTLVADINVGGHASPMHLTNFNGTLLFSADDGINGRELWKSDGTATGTVLVKDINAGAGKSFYTTSVPVPDFTVYGNAVYFSANDGNSGYELWKSDGTNAGTMRVADINPGSGDSTPRGIAVVSSSLFFSANDGSTGRELWKTDGTTVGTKLVADINLGINSSYPSSFIQKDTAVIFSANDGVSGTELWKSDGTTAGTQLLLDFNPGSRSSYHYSFAPCHRRILRLNPAHRRSG